MLTVGGQGAVAASDVATFDAGYFVEAPVLVDAATAAVPAHLYGASYFVWVDSMSQILILTIADD